MQKLFEFDEHIGDWRVLIQSRDIQNGAIQGRHIAPGAVTGDKIAPNTIPGRSFQDECITGDKIEGGTVIHGKIANDAVQTRNIKDGAVTPEKLSDKIVPEVINPLLKPLKDKDADLQNQINSLQMHGMAVSNEFGDNPHIGISQKTLTEAFHNFYQILSDITGEVYEGFSMIVTPDYYVGEEGCTVTITANTLTTVGKFEHIAFFWNSEEEPFLEREDVYGIDGVEVELPLDKLIDDQIIIRCEAKILGQVYTEQKAIKHCDSLWLGAGNSYQSVMIPANLIPASHHMRGAYDVSVGEGEHIIVIVGEALASGFIRADINGFEIDMVESDVIIDGVAYKVFTSVNTYQAGVVNVDING